MNNKERLIANALPDGILVIDNKDNIVWWNSNAEKLLGLRRFSAGASVKDIIGTDVLAQLKIDALPLEKPSRIQDSVFLSMMIRPYQQKQRLLIIKDVTQKHKLESMRQDFVANVSHELRTPLTVFHGFLEILLDQPTVSKKKLKEILLQMSDQSHRMSSLVRDLLLLSRLESALPDVTQYKLIPVAKILQSICDDAAVLSGDKQHIFECDFDNDLLLPGNQEELRSAFSNLIFNAVNYTPAFGKIMVRWRREKNKCVMSVKDSGIGIAKKHLPRITQRFYRVDQSRSHRGEHGTGLGLAIVKHVLLRHGGKLMIESQLHKGSLFRCVF